MKLETRSRSGVEFVGDDVGLLPAATVIGSVTFVKTLAHAARMAIVVAQLTR